MKIVLTGGPSAGKTTIAETLARTFNHQLVLAPEAAAILFRGGFPRGSQGPQVRCQQVAIYEVQKQIENISELDSPEKNLICDRGSLDGLAYWPGSQNDFFTLLNTDLKTELSRYDWVLHMDTAQSSSYSSTQTRVESHSEAEEINRKTKSAWSGHPRQILISNSTIFDKKISQAVLIVDLIFRGLGVEEIRQVIAGVPV
jgi:predicted ATPase